MGHDEFGTGGGARRPAGNVRRGLRPRAGRLRPVRHGRAVRARQPGARRDERPAARGARGPVGPRAAAAPAARGRAGPGGNPAHGEGRPGHRGRGRDARRAGEAAHLASHPVPALRTGGPRARRGGPCRGDDRAQAGRGGPARAGRVARPRQRDGDPARPREPRHQLECRRHGDVRLHGRGGARAGDARPAAHALSRVEGGRGPGAAAARLLGGRADAPHARRRGDRGAQPSGGAARAARYARLWRSTGTSPPASGPSGSWRN